DEDVAFDYQFMQKILPIVSGNDEFTRKILVNLLKLCFIENDKILEEDSLETMKKKVILENIRYELSAKKIIHMLKGYENGYANYWL
ncbi:MAG: hypothetical protein RRY11_08375, partial [Terrisporobacter sp.]